MTLPRVMHADAPPERRCTMLGCRAWTMRVRKGYRADRCSAHPVRLVPVVPPHPADADALWWVWMGVGLRDAGPFTWAEMLALGRER